MNIINPTDEPILCAKCRRPLVFFHAAPEISMWQCISCVSMSWVFHFYVGHA